MSRAFFSDPIAQEVDKHVKEILKKHPSLFDMTEFDFDMPVSATLSEKAPTAPTRRERLIKLAEEIVISPALAKNRDKIVDQLKKALEDKRRDAIIGHQADSDWFITPEARELDLMQRVQAALTNLKTNGLGVLSRLAKLSWWADYNPAQTQLIAQLDAALADNNKATLHEILRRINPVDHSLLYRKLEEFRIPMGEDVAKTICVDDVCNI